ncbi:MAG: hypothetical protein SVU32_02195, partial [Candidatus Nanohaloarchaea archaeon]|nr:hypothetical protein [Candidatus Nanohaloarchaea archaeon]
GSVEQLNITVDLNQNLTAPTISLFPPTNTSGSLLYTNTSAYTCSFGTGCTVRPHPNATRLLVTGTGTGTTLNISAPVRAAAPTTDTNTTWTSHILHGNQTATTAIVTPDLQVTTSYCNGSTTCQVLQNQAFNFTVNITNRGGADHTGNATNVQVSYTVSGLGLADQKLLGDLPVNTSRNVTFEVNITEAGSQSIDIQAIDNLSKAYNASQIKTVDVTDVVEPTIRQISIENQKLSLNSDQQIDVRASDNVGITDVIATVEDPDGNMSNVSLTRIEGDRKDGRWRGAFSETETEGNYTVQTVYVNDSAGNANKQDIERRFAVFDLTASLELQYATLQTGRNINVLSNVSGNTTAVQSVQLNVSKPRGVQEFVDLSRTPRASEYSVTYTNISRSGNYTLKLEVEAGAAVMNRTFIDVPFGTPGIEVFAGNASEIIVPRPGTYNISWQVLPLNGDLRNVSTNLSIGNTAILN